MMGTFYLVDYENVGSGGVTKCSGLDKADELHIFFTENSKSINLDIVHDHGDAVLVTHKVPIRSQSIDMHIVSYMGYLIGKYEKSQIKIVIVSKDKDYDNLIKFWSDKAEISRKQKIDVSTTKKTQQVKKTPETNTPSQKTKTVSKSSANTVTKTASKKPTKSELKLQFDKEVKHALSQAGYAEAEIRYIAKRVCEHFGEENYKQQIHNDLRIDLGEEIYQEAYNSLKPVLKKFSKYCF